MSRSLAPATILLSGILMTAPIAPGAEPDEPPLYQLRTYHTAPGKLPVLLERFQARNLPLYDRHAIELVGAWTPADAGEADRLVYLVSFPDRAAADRAWADLDADPEWQQTFEAETKEHGTVVARVETVYLTPTGYGPTPAEAAAGGGDHLYILRTYTTPPGKLDALNARFRDHTVALFRKHGLDSVLYTTPTEASQGADNTLIYFLQVPDRAAADASWDAFRNDPEWQRVKSASETDGALTEKVESLYLKPTGFSPLN